MCSKKKKKKTAKPTRGNTIESTELVLEGVLFSVPAAIEEFASLLMRVARRHSSEAPASYLQ
jgi:hypothetical protein